MHTTLLLLIWCLLGLSANGAVEDSATASVPATNTRIALRGVHFAPNLGQWRDQTISYGFRTRGMEVALRESSLTMHLRRPRSSRAGNTIEDAGPYRFRSQLDSALEVVRHHRAVEHESFELEMTFPGSNVVQPVGGEPQSAYFNFFIGDDQSKWRTAVSSLGKIVYSNLYNGVDLHITGNDGGVLKYEFHCAPSANHTQIALHYEGIDGLRIDDSGNLLIDTPLGTLVDHAPRVWQVIHGQRRDIPARFEVLDADTYTIALLERPDASYPLIIDPDVEWMYYLGGLDYDDGEDIAIDDEGNALLTGFTHSFEFVGRNNSYQGGSFDAFALRMSPLGELEWMTYLGGNADDFGHGIAADSEGRAIITGRTRSTDFAGRTNSYHGGGHLGDAFVARINQAGALDWMIYVGGSEDERGTGIAVDDEGNALATGTTDSWQDFEGRINESHGGDDPYVIKIDPAGTLLWMTYLGGSGTDEGLDVAVDGAGNALVTGTTNTTDFEGRNNSFHGGDGWGDAFIARVPPTGIIQWMTYVGGSENEQALGVAVDDQGNAFATGRTRSVDFSGRNNSHHGSYVDSYVVKVSPSGSTLWMTYIGGSADESGHSIAVSSAGNALVTGDTDSTDFEGRVNSYHGGISDAYMANVDSSGALQRMSFLGGDDEDIGFGIATDEAGNALVGGITMSRDFEGRNNSFYNFADAFIVKMRVDNGVLAILTDFTVTFGTLISGTLQNLVESDNSRVRVRSHFGFTSFEPNVLDVLVGATTAVQNPSLLDLTVEGRISQSGGTSKLRLRNWSTNALQQVHQYPIGGTETVNTIDDVSAANRVRPSDGRVELSIRQSVMVVFTASGFDSFTDQIRIAVE